MEEIAGNPSVPAGDTEDGPPRRLRIGSVVITLLGLSFGSALVICGSVFRWRSDAVLGLYNQSGWHFSNIVSGDGKITLALAVLLALGLVAGAFLLDKWSYAVAVASSALLLAMSIYEIIQLACRPGITGPGHGLYMVLGGSVAALLCSLGGYLMMAEKV